MHEYSLEKCFNNSSEERKKQLWLKKTIDKTDLTKYNDIMRFSKTLYEKGYGALDIMHYIEMANLDILKKNRMLLAFNKVKKEFRNEKLLMVFILNFLFIRSDYDLENISFM